MRYSAPVLQAVKGRKATIGRLINFFSIGRECLILGNIRAGALLADLLPV